MDWNGDGNHDWQDDAFYNNVISSSETDSNQPDHSSGNPNRLSAGSILVIAFVVYLILRLIGVR